jgi:hypothetical protein
VTDSELVVNQLAVSLSVLSIVPQSVVMSVIASTFGMVKMWPHRSPIIKYVETHADEGSRPHAGHCNDVDIRIGSCSPSLRHG